MLITQIQSYKTNTQNNELKLSPMHYRKRPTDSVNFSGKIPDEHNSLTKRLGEIISYPINLIKKMKAEKQAQIDARLKADAEEQARREAILRKRKEMEIQREKDREIARRAIQEANNKKLEHLKTLPIEDLANEYRAHLRSNDIVWATKIKSLIQSKGYILLDGNPVKEFSQEAYRPLDVLPYTDLSNSTFIPKYAENPPLIKNPNIATPPQKGQYDLSNFAIYNLNYCQRGYGSLRFPSTKFSGNTGLDIPGKERGWTMGHSYRKNLKDIDINHYCTTLSYRHEVNAHGYAPGFSIHIEGQLSEKDIETIKDLLIDKGYMEQIIKAENKESESYKIFIDMLNEILEYLNHSAIS